MKINRIRVENIGPFDSLDLQLNKESISLIGANASGKTFLLSSIVDYIFEVFNASGLEDILPSVGMRYSYYRYTSGNFAKNTFKDALIWIEGEIDGIQIYYLEKYGFENVEYVSSVIGVPPEEIPWPNSDSSKIISSLSNEEKQKIREHARRNPIFFLPATKFENESWKTKKFFRNNHAVEMPSSRLLGHPIEMFSSIDENESWLVNEFIDMKLLGDPLCRMRMSVIDNYITDIMQSGEELHLDLHFNRGDRLYIVNSKNEVKLRSLSHLSLGQMSVLNLIVNIFRLGDQSVNPKLIKGLVVIDEIDTHLTGDFKYKIIPDIINFFSNVQFIITTHDPESVIGLENNNSARLIELPSGNDILAKNFIELKKLRKKLKNDNKIVKGITRTIQAVSKPVLIVEDGCINLYKVCWLKSKGIQFTEQNLDQIFEQEAKFSIIPAKGRRNLFAFLNNNLSDTIRDKRIVGLFDFDDAYNDFNGLSSEGGWGNILEKEENCLYKENSDGHRFAMLLPVPQFRSDIASKKYKSNSCLEVELLFSDQVLGERNCGIDDTKLSNPPKFIGDKTTFWRDCISYSKEDFSEFAKMFEIIESFLGIESDEEQL